MAEAQDSILAGWPTALGVALRTGYPDSIVLASGKSLTAPGGVVGNVTGVASEATTLTGLTASVAELNYNDITAAGTAQASKTAVLGPNKNLDTLVIADGGLKLGSGAGTAVTATAAELNLLDRTGAAGVNEASKALVAGAQNNLDTLVLSAGATAAAQVLGIGPTNGTGLRYMVIDESVTIPSAQAAVALTNVVPDGAILISVQASIDTTVVATTAVKVGIGYAADPDAYGLTADLLLNTKVDTLIAASPAVGTGEGIIGLYACDTNGDAAGTIDSGVVRVRLVYAVLVSLPNAA